MPCNWRAIPCNVRSKGVQCLVIGGPIPCKLYHGCVLQRVRAILDLDPDRGVKLLVGQGPSSVAVDQVTLLAF